MQTILSRPSCPPRPRFLELAHKKGPKRSTYTPFPETGEQINRHTSPRTTYQVKGRPSGRKGADRGAPLPPICGGPPKFWPQLGFPGAPSCQATSGRQPARRKGLVRASPRLG